MVDPKYLQPNEFVDSDHPEIVQFAEQEAGHLGELDAAVHLNRVVRDRLRYNPWRVRFERSAWKASEVLKRPVEEGGHCIDKALLLAGLCRALGIPSRLHFANVRNHIGTAKLEEQLGTDLLIYHGYTELFLEGKWVSATPAFNLELCRKLNVQPLEFDGRQDSIFQQYSPDGTRFMEYVTDHGSHAGIPYEDMIAAWKEHYPMEEVWPQ